MIMIFGERDKISPKITKKCLSRFISQEPHIMWLSFMVYLCKMMIPPSTFLHLSRPISQEQYSIWSWILLHLCKMMISPGAFFYFFKFWIFWILGRVKGQKVDQNDKKFCQSLFISLEPYLIWLSFRVHLCKMIISPGIFLIFSKFLFFRLLGGSKWQKIMFVALHISGSIHHMIVIFGTHVSNDDIFWKIWFSRLLGG